MQPSSPRRPRFRTKAKAVWCVAGAMLAFAAWARPHAVHAHAGPPASLRLFVPADRPELFVLVTTFGVVTSDDAGRTWAWACDHGAAAGAFGHRMGAGGRLLAVSYGASVFSDDLGCSWQTSAITLPRARVLDVVPDPVDASRAWAIAAVVTANSQDNALVLSVDGGASFERVLRRTSYPTLMTSAASSGSVTPTIYLSGRRDLEPWLARSDDGGTTWDERDVGAQTGAFELRVLAVHPTRPSTVYLQVLGDADHALAISDDGGATIRIATRVRRGVLTSLLRRSDGTLLVAGVTADGSVVSMSRDDGATWTEWARSPRANDLAERDGELYVVADDQRDGFAIAVTSADGARVDPLFHFRDVASTRRCVTQLCAASCAYEVDRSNFRDEVCRVAAPAIDAAAPVEGVDAASTAALDASVDPLVPRDAASTGTDAAPPPPASAGGCACATSTQPSRAPSLVWTFVAALAVRRRRTRR